MSKEDEVRPERDVVDFLNLFNGCIVKVTSMGTHGTGVGSMVPSDNVCRRQQGQYGEHSKDDGSILSRLSIDNHYVEG